jgi:hypothetical protein
MRPSNHRALLSQAAEQLFEVPLSNGAVVRAWRSQRIIAGKQREVVVAFNPHLHEGQLRGLHQALQHSYRQLEQIKPHSRLSVEAVKRELEKICAPPYLCSLLGYKIDTDQHGATQFCLWSDWQEYQRLVTHYFGLRVLITDRVEHGADHRSLSGASQSRSRVSRHERSLHAFYPSTVSLDRSEVARSRFYLCYRLSANHLVALARYPEGCLPRHFPPPLGRSGQNTVLPLNRINWPQRKAEGAYADRGDGFNTQQTGRSSQRYTYFR